MPRVPWRRLTLLWCPATERFVLRTGKWRDRPGSDPDDDSPKTIAFLWW